MSVHENGGLQRPMQHKKPEDLRPTDEAYTNQSRARHKYGPESCQRGGRMKPPDVIYLQWFGDAPTTYVDDDDNEVPIPEEEMEGPTEGDYYGEDVTWCAERIYEADIPYRRADEADAAIRELVEALEDTTESAIWYGEACGDRMVMSSEIVRARVLIAKYKEEA